MRAYTTISIKPEAHQALKVQAAKESISIYDLITRITLEYVKASEEAAKK